jgi:hypothetical protein
MADDKQWPRLTRPLWAGLRVVLILALVLQVLLIAPAAYELWLGALTADAVEQNLAALGVVLGSLLLSVLWLVVFLLCVVYTSRITFRMMKNLDVLEAPGERMIPTMAVVWYFIPIANLLMPFRGFKQIWNGTFELSAEPGPSDGALGLWWLCWILSSITGTLSFRLSLESGGASEFGPTDAGLYNASLWLGIVSSVLGALAAWFMIKSFGPVSRAQDQIIRARAPAA